MVEASLSERGEYENKYYNICTVSQILVDGIMWTYSELQKTAIGKC